MHLKQCYVVVSSTTRMPYLLVYAEKPSGEAKWDLSDLKLNGAISDTVEKAMMEAAKVQPVLNLLELHGWQVCLCTGS